MTPLAPHFRRSPSIPIPYAWRLVGTTTTGQRSRGLRTRPSRSPHSGVTLTAWDGGLDWQGDRWKSNGNQDRARRRLVWTNPYLGSVGPWWVGKPRSTRPHGMDQESMWSKTSDLTSLKIHGAHQFRWWCSQESLLWSVHVPLCFPTVCKRLTKHNSKLSRRNLHFDMHQCCTTPVDHEAALFTMWLVEVTVTTTKNRTLPDTALVSNTRLILFANLAEFEWLTLSNIWNLNIWFGRTSNRSLG